MDDFNLRGRFEMTTFLTSLIVPIVRIRFVEWLQRSKIQLISIMIVLAYIDQIIAEHVVIFRFQIIFQRIVISCRTTTESHPIRCRIRKCLEDCIRSLCLDFHHDRALRLVCIPIVRRCRRCFKSFHLGALALAFHHMSIRMRRVVTASDIIAEDVHIQLVRRSNQIHNIIHLLLIPLAHLCCPPAKRTSPSFDRLQTLSRIENNVIITWFRTLNRKRQQQHRCHQNVSNLITALYHNCLFIIQKRGSLRINICRETNPTCCK